MINTTTFQSLDDLVGWLIEFFNSSDFKLDSPITREGITTSLDKNLPVQVNFAGSEVALVFGTREVIEFSADRFVHTEVFNTRDLI